MAQVSNTMSSTISNNILSNGSTSFGDLIGPDYNHVTVVQVEETEGKKQFDDEFVTVVQVGDESEGSHSSKSIEEEITIYRLPGERLGMALKFEGGTNATENINKVFIQSINADSPASKAQGQQLQFLKEGDEIIQIDGRFTSSMTRLECIGLLRDAMVCIKIRVKRELSCQCMHSLSNIKVNALNSNVTSTWNQSETVNSFTPKVNSNGTLKKVPPPVPPRMATTILSSKRKTISNCQTRLDNDSDSIEKPPRKKSSQPPPLPPRRPKVPPPKPPKEKEIKSIEQNALNDNTSDEQIIDDFESDTAKSEVTNPLPNPINDTISGKDKQMEENRITEAILPSEPTVYLDLFADEDRMYIESESDDTGSSVSTIIERFSRTSTANSSFSDNINRKTPTIDIGRVLSPFEKLERELDHKEALQAFVNKAAAALIADQDLREITDENLCQKNSIGYDIDINDYCDSPNLDLPNTNSTNNSAVEDLSTNIQIIVPPEEFCNNNDLIDLEHIEAILPEPENTNFLSELSFSQIDSEPTEAKFQPEFYDLHSDFNESTLPSDCLEMQNENDSRDEPTESVDDTIDIVSVEKEVKSIEDIVSISDSKIDLIEDLPAAELKQSEPKEEMIEPIEEKELNRVDDCMAQIDEAFDCIEDATEASNTKFESIDSIEELINQTELPKSIDEIDKQIKLIEEKIQLDMEEKHIKDFKELNDQIELIESIIDIEHKTELVEGIDGLNEKTEVFGDSMELVAKVRTENDSKCKLLDSDKKIKFARRSMTSSQMNRRGSDEDGENCMHSIDCMKIPATISLIPKRLPTIKPRKAKSYGNLPSLYISLNTPDKKPSLIPRPILKNSCLVNNRSIKENSVSHNNCENVVKVQNTKYVQNCKTKTPTDRKKSDVLSSPLFESKIPVNLKSEKSTIKSESLMDLTKSFTTTEIKNSISADDSVELIQSPQNESLELTETNQTESSLQSKKLNNNISGTESSSEVDFCEVQNQADTIESVVQQQTPITDCSNRDQIEEILLTQSTPTSNISAECPQQSQTENISEKEVEEDQLDMIRVRKLHDMSEISMDSTCLPPTYARQPPDGREITLNYVDLHSTNANDSNIPPVLCEIFQMPASVHEDSGVFIDNDSPSPELDFSVASISKGGPNVAVTRIKYKSNADNSSDADTGVTSMSSDSMDELDSGPLPNPKFKKQLLAKSHNPSTAFPMETAPNGLNGFNGFNANNNSNNSNSNSLFITKSSDVKKSMKERIAMFDVQRSDSLENNEERKESLKSESLKSASKSTSFKSEPPLTQRTLNYESSTLNGKNELMSETNSSSLSTADKSKLIGDKQCFDKNNDTGENGSIYNTKTAFMHIKSSSLSDNSSNPQQNTTNTQYTGHLQPSYLRFSSRGSTNETSINTNTSPGIGLHKPLLNGSLLSSILETRKQNASKLKGLIIPDIPATSQPAVSKALPTIFSNTSTSSTLFTSKPEEVSSLTNKQSVHQTQSQSNLSSNYPLQRQSLLSEPPWIATNNASIPKYSPAFKRRQLELPRSLSLLNNISSDNIDSSNTNVNLSNCLTNDAQQFHFSLSHSKPVIPLMPETAIASPNFDPINSTPFSKPSIEQQLAINFNEPYGHSSVERRYSADNNMNCSKFSLEKRSSADSVIANKFQGPMHSIMKSDIISMQSTSNSVASNNRINNPMTTYSTENKIRPIIMERKSIATHNTPVENEQSINRKTETFKNSPQQLSRDSNQFITRDKFEMPYLNGNDKSYGNLSSKALFNSDYSDDDSSTISHKTSEDSSTRADDSASDTASDSLDHAFAPEFTRPKVLGTQLTVLKNSENDKISVKNDNNTESVKNFRALAEKWEQRSGLESSTPNGKNIPPPLPPKPSACSSRMPPSLMPRTKKLITDSVPLNINKVNEANNLSNNSQQVKQLETTFKQLELDNQTEPSITSIDKKSDSSSDSSCDSVGKASNNCMTSRSRSVSDICKVFECNGAENPPTLKANKSSTSLNTVKAIQNNSTNFDSDRINESQINDYKSLEEDKLSNLNDIYREDLPEIQTNIENNTNNLSLNNNKVVDNINNNDVDKNYDNINNDEENNKLKYSEDKLTSWDKTRENEDQILNHHHRMSSIDSIASDSGASTSGAPVRSLGQRTSSTSNLRDSQYGSVTSLASTTSLISPQELQQLIDEANQSLEVNDINSHNIQVVVLHREYKSSGNIGITLAGGSDCETKEITVHRVINGSLTDRDGRIKKGDRILSINGKILKGVTHKEALDIMKAPRPEVVIVLSRYNASNGSDSVNGFHSRQSSSDMNELINGNLALQSNINEDIISETDMNSDSNYKILRAELTKDVAGLGFILEGGKDSPLGDKPLAIKRIFRGGPADKEGTLASGDEVISVNDHSVHNMTRTEAWNFLKKLPEGPVVLMVRRKRY